MDRFSARGGGWGLSNLLFLLRKKEVPLLIRYGEKIMLYKSTTYIFDLTYSGSLIFPVKLTSGYRGPDEARRGLPPERDPEDRGSIVSFFNIIFKKNKVLFLYLEIICIFCSFLPL